MSCTITIVWYAKISERIHFDVFAETFVGIDKLQQTNNKAW